MDKLIVVFIDDILLYLKSEEEHQQHLQITLQTLQEHDLYAKFLKCEFWMINVHFMGHIVSLEGIQVHP